MSDFSSASVKVMRSYDYCHFEVVLSKSDWTNKEEVDSLRKEAARLVDAAVEQYQIAKFNADAIAADKYRLEQLERRAKDAESTPEPDRTPKDKAIIKALSDGHYRNRPRYNYEDEWEEPSWDVDNDDVMF